MIKEAVSGNYIDEWRLRTADWQRPQDRRTLILGGRDENIGGTIAKWLSFCGDDVTMMDKDELDISDGRRVLSFFRKDEHAGFDTLILNAGETHLDWFEDQNAPHIYDVIDNTLTGPMLAANAWVKATIGRPCLKYLVFIGSMAYKAVLNGSAPYCAAKAGIAHLVECLGYELTPKGYRVFGVHPSNTQDGPMTETTIEGLMRYRSLSREEAEKYWNTGLLMPHHLHRADIADTVAWLTSGKADFQSGSNIELKGGQR